MSLTSHQTHDPSASEADSSSMSSLQFPRATSFTAARLEAFISAISERAEDPKSAAAKIERLGRRIFQQLGAEKAWAKITDDSLDSKSRSMLLALYLYEIPESAPVVAKFLAHEIARVDIDDKWLFRACETATDNSVMYTSPLMTIELRGELALAARAQLERICKMPLSETRTEVIKVLLETVSLHGSVAEDLSYPAFLASLADSRTPDVLLSPLCSALTDALWPYREYPDTQGYRQALWYLAEAPLAQARKIEALAPGDEGNTQLALRLGGLAALASRISAIDGLVMLKEIELLPNSDQYIFAALLAIQEGLGDIAPLHGPIPRIPESSPTSFKRVLKLILPSFIEARRLNDRRIS